MNARRTSIGLAAALVLVLAGCGSEPTPSPRAACPTEPPTANSATATIGDAVHATVTVSGAVDGEFVIELYDDAPIATANFVALARCGFYEGIWFHRILAGFVIQAGDPQTKSQSGDFEGIGTGGPGYDFEIEPPSDALMYEPYSVSMANDQVANGSQFFVALADLDEGLPRAYSIIGQVIEGQDVIDAVGAVPVNDPRIGVPLELVTIDSIIVSGGSGPTPSGN
jgi:cyclophilin family peptidyl-prolyl cis-trans isomerase